MDVFAPWLRRHFTPSTYPRLAAMMSAVCPVYNNNNIKHPKDPSRKI